MFILLKGFGMELMTLIGGIIIALIIGALDSSVSIMGVTPAKKQSDRPDTDRAMTHDKTFAIEFEVGQKANAILLDPSASAEIVIESFHLKTPSPCIFISGGASNMSPEDMERTRIIMEDGIAKFAAENGITIIDGGTEAGVMQMIGEARRAHHYSFPLIGVAPAGKIKYPGKENINSEAELESNHSHFVLVDSENWGDESQMIINLTRQISGMGEMQALGILINGGKVSQQDIYLATAKGDQKIPILVLEGSGRFAEELATAFRTGHANHQILQAIIAGGDIKLLATGEGVETMRSKLDAHFHPNIG